MTTFLALFEVGAIGFWLLLTFASIVYIVALESRKFWLSLVVTLGLLAGYGKTLLAQNWTIGNILAAVGIWALAGVLWSIYRWFRHVRTEVEKLKNKEGEYGRTYVTNLEGVFDNNTSPAQHKAEITAWIAYWPWSLAWHFTSEFWTNLYEMVKGIYQNITDRAKADVKFPVKD
jgi:hypothetical protein